MEAKELKNRIEGKVVTATDDQYENLRSVMSWNQLTPKRYPRLIVQVANEQDIVEAVHFARTNKMRIAVRGGGHSWVGFSLRDESLLIDLGRLKQVSIDQVDRIATIQPAVTGRELPRIGNASSRSGGSMIRTVFFTDISVCKKKSCAVCSSQLHGGNYSYQLNSEHKKDKTGEQQLREFIKKHGPLP